MIVSVAVNVPAHQLFDYAAPDGESLLGRRVRVPFGTRKMVGVIMAESETSSAPPHVKIKTVAEVYADMPPLPSATLDLIRFCASYYHAPIGAVAAAALPIAFRRATLSRLPHGFRRCGELPPRGEKAAAVWAFLQNGDCFPAATIQKATGASAEVLRRMTQNGFLLRETYFPPPSAALPETPPAQTAEQKTATAAIQMTGGFAPYLLFGETGSGKTEVYLRLTEKALAAGGKVLILTPEIHLTPQLEEAFARRFPARRLCVLHSALTDGERARRWLAALCGKADVVLGTRLAVFTPLPGLRLIVVDEEHDDSYKQDEGVIFSARDIAVWRARREKTPLVCGSATPSLESYENARRGRYQLLRMRTRARAGSLEKALAKEDGPLFHGMSQQFLAELDAAIKNEKQAMVFVNRRGYSPMLICRRCRWTVMCRACEARMTWHRRRGALLCHRCGASAPPPPKCESCGGEMIARGIGTQRIEEALNARFAPLRAVRLDSDALSRRESFAAMRDEIASGAARLLVGTQIIAKGHNFPRLSFIGVLNADAGLWSADFRAEERLLILLRQVIGRGTRNRDGCRVLIQTANPTHPFYRDLMADDLEECWRRIAEERRRARFPPFSYCALLRASAPSDAILRKFFVAAKRAAKDICPPQVLLFDPAPSAVAKRANRHRWQLLIQSDSRAALHRFLAEWRQKMPPAAARWSFDVDPLSI